MIRESNELLGGLRKLYADSDANEQVRLMTIAPTEWGRQKIEKWCVFYTVKKKGRPINPCPIYKYS